jgi:demethylmenaquinone methyltransferase/2-methoxy-6-polyprenyl-1,4-benzoquinol methylase
MRWRKNSKKRQHKKLFVRKIFDEIAQKYDIISHILSFGIDIYWRKKLIKMVSKEDHPKILDMATGTAVLAIKAAQRTKAKIDAYDISTEMLAKARLKVRKKNLASQITLKEQDCEVLEMENYFNAIMVGFGIRNFYNTQSGLKSMFEALKKNGKLYILEFSTPENPIFKRIYFLYLSIFLPLIGMIFTGKKYAYQYFQESIKKYPSGKAFVEIMESVGFSDIKTHKMTGGIVTIYIAEK